MEEKQKVGEDFDHRKAVANDEINLFDFLSTLLRHMKLIIGICVATFLLACIITLLMPNIYTATARSLPPAGCGKKQRLRRTICRHVTKSHRRRCNY